MGRACDGAAVTVSTDKSGKLIFGKPRRLGAAAIAGLVAVLLMAATAGMASAQNNQPPAAGTAAAPQAQPVPAPPAPPIPVSPASPTPSGLALPPQPPPVEKRGFLNDFGHWWNDSIADFNAKMKDQESKADEFNKKSADAAKDAATATQQAMKNAADALVHLPTSRLIEIHELCAIAGNGAADCATAATNACKSKGFNSGQPVDVRTAEKCTASLWVSGQNPVNGDCPVETVVLRAACQ
jgi:hypothetical protein